MKPTLALLLYINPLFFTRIFCSTLPALECILKMNMAVHRKQQHLSFFVWKIFSLAKPLRQCNLGELNVLVSQRNCIMYFHDRLLYFCA